MIYWINLDECKDRKQFMEEQFKKNNHTHTRIPAIRPSQYPFTTKKPLSLPEYGCLLSHLKACKEVLNNSESYSVIVEDDMIIPSFNFDKLVNTAPKDWEILQLFVINKPRLAELIEKYKQGILWDPWYECNFSTGIYIINKKGANKLLNTVTDLSKFDYKPFADAVLYRNAKTYTYTYPHFYSNLQYESVIHTGHFKRHSQAVQYIQHIQSSIAHK